SDESFDSGNGPKQAGGVRLEGTAGEQASGFRRQGAAKQPGRLRQSPDGVKSVPRPQVAVLAVPLRLKP
ncbi:MAG: hypothetical protein ACKN85_09920, partial [Pirellula sp.]